MGLADRESVQSGPIRVSENGRHFVDAQGHPFFWLGDTAWPLFACYPRTMRKGTCKTVQRGALR